MVYSRFLARYQHRDLSAGSLLIGISVLLFSLGS